MELVDNGIPEGVKVVNTVVVGKRERVSTSVTVGEVAVDFGGSVKWLVDVSNIMDEESQSIGFSEVISSESSSAHELLVHVGVLVAWLSCNPASDVVDGNSDVVDIVSPVLKI